MVPTRFSTWRPRPASRCAWLAIVLLPALPVGSHAQCACDPEELILECAPAWTSEQVYRVEGLVLGDVDLDGDLDLVCAERDRDGADPGCLLFRNDGRGLSALPTWESGKADGYDVALGDIDGDGLLDLVCVSDGPNWIYLNRGDGFGDEPWWTSPEERVTYSVALGDVDRDGDLDLAFGNIGGFNALFRNDGDDLVEVWTADGQGATVDVEFGDVDGDGRLDLVTANGNSKDETSLYLNVGGPSVLASAPAWTSGPLATNGIALGDVDGDGGLDLVCGNSRGPNVIFWNDGSSFARSDTLPRFDAGYTENLALGDLDRDGDLDLVVANYGHDEIYLNEGGAFGATPAWCSERHDHSYDVVLGDVDGDGDLDAVFGYGTEKLQLSRNPSPQYENAGRLVPEIVGRPTDFALTDFDEDGDLDLAVAKDGQNVLYRNDPGGAFGTSWVSEAGSLTFATVAADFDGDGDVDLAFGEDGANTLYLRRDDTGEFSTTPDWSSATEDVTTDLAAGDVDGDGVADLAVGNLDAGNQLYVAEGGTFPEHPSWTSAATDEPTRAVILADMDADGDLDLVCGNEGANTIYLNRGGSLETTPAWTSTPRNLTTSLATGDVDGDGRLDLVCGNEGENTLYLSTEGEPPLSLEPAWRSLASANTKAVELVDVDHDGDLDLISANLGLSELHLNDRGLLSALPAWTSVTTLTCFAIADLDRDGDADLIFGDGLTASTRLYPGIRNSPPRPGAEAGVNQLENTAGFLNSVRAPEPVSNVLEVAFRTLDLESDPLWVVLDAHREGDLEWTSPQLAGPFPTSPLGVEASADWSIETLPFDSRDATLRLRAVSIPSGVSANHSVGSHLIDLGNVVPLRPTFAVTDSLFDFGTVTIGDSAWAAIPIHNPGTTELRIENADVELATDPIPGGSELSVASHLPLVIPAGSSDSLLLRLAPREVFEVAGEVRVSSNDPLLATPTAFGVRAEILDLEFVTEPLAQGEVPVGDAVTVLVTPARAVRIEEGRLFHRAAGTSSFQSVSLRPSESGEVFSGVIPGESVAERGVEFYVEVENDGLVRTDPPGAPDEWFELEVGSPALVRSDPVPNDRGRFAAGRSIAVRIILPEGSFFREGTLFHRRGGETRYDSLEITQSGLEPDAIIPETAVTARGVEYWVRVTTETSGPLTDPPTTPHERPHVVRTIVESLADENSWPATTYRMLSVPLDFEGELGESESVADLLADEPGFGSYDPTRWRLFRYFPSVSATLEFGSGEEPRFQPAPGRAFWVISRATQQIDSRPFAGLSVSTAAPYPIELQPGWNQIGNPFAFPVAWSDVTTSEEVGPPHAFGVEGGTAGYLEDPPEVLVPFAGYMIRNFSTLPETAWVFPNVASATTSRTLSENADPDGEWKITLAVVSESGAESVVSLGTRPGAREEWDPFDRESPPPPPELGATLSIDNRHWKRRAGAYRRDVRPSRSRGDAWTLEIRAGSEAEPVRIRSLLERPTPPGFTARIVDPQAGVVREPGEDYRVLTLPAPLPYRLFVLAGPREFVERESGPWTSRPASLVLEAAAPNPLRQATRIRFGLPASSRVELSLFDLAGRRIRTLASESSLEAGFHNVIWDGRDETGRRVAAGVYFYRLLTNLGSESRKMVVVP